MSDTVLILCLIGILVGLVLIPVTVSLSVFLIFGYFRYSIYKEAVRGVKVELGRQARKEARRARKLKVREDNGDRGTDSQE